MIKRMVLLLFLVQFFCSFYFASDAFTPKVHKVVIKDMKFVPAEIMVKSGDTIVWVNEDIVMHNVTEEKSKVWSSPVILHGKSFKMAVKQSASYFCSIHPVMKGKIQVQ